jgi:hypothetical protein
LRIEEQAELTETSLPVEDAPGLFTFISLSYPNSNIGIVIMALKAADEFFGVDEDEDKVEAHEGSCSRSDDLYLRNDDLRSGFHLAESAAIEQRFHTIGYHEAYDQSNEVRLQEGFENGYRDTYDASCRIGELLGKVIMQSKLLELREQQSSNGEENARDNAGSLLAFKVARTVRTFLANKDNRNRLSELEQQVKEIIEPS